MDIRHNTRKQFLKGIFGNGGVNLFVDASGTMRRIMDNDLNGDGLFDIVLPNSHGYIERGPTFIYSQKGSKWNKTELPHDSCWEAKAADLDGDGYLDLIIANGENGVTSELQSFIYWGGQDGLTGDCTTFDTIGAYDIALWDLTGNGLKDVIFTTAWHDHHNEGKPLYQKVFVQTSTRQFIDATDKFKLSGLATTSLICEDLNSDGYPEVVLANYRKGYNSNTDSFIYWGKLGGFNTKSPLRLPTHYALQVLAADLNNDGLKELIFTGGNKLMIYWNEGGSFHKDNRLALNIEGTDSQFGHGILHTDVADVDGDGIPELVTGTKEGVEIRKANRLKSVYKKLPCYSCPRVKCADIKNTGLPDIITSYYYSPKSYDTNSVVFWNSKNGYNINNTTVFDTHGPMGCTAADLDNDGVKEIIFCNTMKGPSQYDPEFPVFVYYGTSDHKYLNKNRRNYPVNMMSHSYITADVDNDGYVELVATSVNGARIFKGTPEGPDPYNYYDLLHSTTELVGVGGVVVGDFNRDGWLDLIVSSWVYGYSKKDLSNSTFVYFGGPDGYSNDRRMLLPAYTESAQSVYLADINNDGYIDVLYGDGRGFIGVYYGGPEGFSRKHHGRIQLKDYNGALILGITAADIDRDGWLELFVTTAGHYTRLPSHLYVLREGKNNFPMDKMTIFETGGTTGFAAIADMRGSGNLDLILPFYSTSETRELPARIFYGDGKGDFDWDNPLNIDCLASIASLPVDLTGNGYPDLFICCHRNNLGHIVNSKLIMNGPGGLDINNAQDILGYGPHCFTIQNQGNIMDRGDIEYYTSPVFECRKPLSISWWGEVPFKTSLSMRVRFGTSMNKTLNAKWSESITKNGSPLGAPNDTAYMQYQVAFHAPGFVNSPRLTSVSIKCG